MTARPGLRVRVHDCDCSLCLWPRSPGPVCGLLRECPRLLLPLPAARAAVCFQQFSAAAEVFYFIFYFLYFFPHFKESGKIVQQVI